MPKNFDFYGGPPADQGALAQTYAAEVQAASHGGDQLLGLFQTIANLVNASADRRQRSKEVKGAKGTEVERQKRQHAHESKESELDARRKARAAEIGQAADREAQARTFEQQRALSTQGIVGQLGQTGISSQGLDAGALMDLFQQQGGAGAAQPAVPPPGGPGSYLIDPQQEGSGYQRLRQEERKGSFSDVPRHPPPMTWEERKFRMTEEEKDQAADTAMQIRRLQVQGDKNIVTDSETTLQDALGMGMLDDEELEQAVISAYPSLAPKLSLTGDKSDRRALDAKLKQLQKKHKVSVPNGPGLTGLDWSSASDDPTVIDAALEEVFGEGFEVPMTAEDMHAAGNKKLLERFPEYVNRFQPASVQVQPEIQAAPGPPQPAVWTKGLLQQAGLNFDQLPPGLQSAAQARQPVVAGPDGRIMFAPRQDGTPPSPDWQAELDQLQSIPEFQGVLQAIMGTGAAINQTPKEIKAKAGAVRARGERGVEAIRVEDTYPFGRGTGIKEVYGTRDPRLQGQAPPRSGPAGAKTERGAQPGRERSGGPVSPGQSALERYRASKQKPEAKKSGAAKRPSKVGLVGLSESAMLDLILSGAGGLR